jgi:metal-responsive CopG/Arc/MetJ family transcriptional regulator
MLLFVRNEVCMARVNVVIQDDLLKELDRAAAEEHVSRSGYLQDAVRAHLTHRRAQQEAREQRARMEKAAAEMDRLAEKFGKWDGAKIIRQFRDSRSRRKA